MLKAIALASAVMLSLSGCTLTSHWAYTNNEEVQGTVGTTPKASFEIAPRATKTQPRVLVLLAFSGGGSRAAYFSARTMQALQKVPGRDGTINVMNEVDLISSVSGGSLAAAYYASSYAPDDPKRPTGRRIWDEATVTDLMSQNYIERWLGNWFWPGNILKFWFTAFDRTDIMAQTFADNFFDSTLTGIDLRLDELNPARPNLVLNATIGSRSFAVKEADRAKRFGSIFTFTAEDFSTKLRSSIADYEVARAVMASATFPGAFNYMTLRDYNKPECSDEARVCYLHVFDGGNSDNLGLISLKRVLLGHDAAAIGNSPQEGFQRIVVIFVDAFRRSQGADPASPNPREFLDYVVDTNFLDATDSLLEANRERILQEFFSRSIANYEKPEQCEQDNLPAHACVAWPGWRGPRGERLQELLKQKMFFFHVTFDAVTNNEVRAKLHAIPTTFKFANGEMDAIRMGIEDIFGNDQNTAKECVRRLGAIIAEPGETAAIVHNNLWCGGAEPAERDARKRMMRK
jgi:NTE family protein